MFKLFGKNKVKNQAVSSGDDSLVLFVNTMGWQAQFLDKNGKAKGKLRSSSAALMTSRGSQRMRDIFSEVIQALGKSELNKTGAISILFEGPHLVFSDNKPEGLTAPSPATAREFGGRMLNVPHITFGQCDFGIRRKGKQTQSSAYAFADADMLRDCLAIFDQQATKVIEICPFAYPILESFDRPEEDVDAAAAIYFGAHESTIILTNYASASVMTRSIPVGLLSIAEAISESTGANIEDTLNNLGKRDFCEKITIDKTSKQSMTSGPIEQALHPQLLKMGKTLDETLTFFNQQRIGGSPNRLLVYGQHAMIKGLTAWIGKLVNLSIHEEQNDLLQQFAVQSHPVAMNLLKGAADSLIVVGNVKYVFSGEKLVSQDALSKMSGKQAATSNTKSRGSSRRGSRRRESKPDFLTVLKAKFAGGDGEQNGDDGENHGVFFIGFYVLIALCAFMANLNYKKINKYYLGAAQQYETKVLQNLDFHSSVVTETVAPVEGTDIGLKVLWTEKFLRIGKAVNENLWLTDIYLKEDERQLGDVAVKTKKLSVEGAALPSTLGHIAEIANFIERLKNDSIFMSDFRRITFNGAHIDESESDHVVRFVFDAWYDQNKRVEKKKKQKSSGGKGGIQDMQNNISNHNERLEQITPGVR